MNIDGTFTLKIDGKERELKANFAALEKLERQIFKRPILSVLNDAVNGMIFATDVVDVIMVGLQCNKDTRFKRDEIGQEVTENGVTEYMEFFCNYLTYLVTGKENPEVDVMPDDKKK